VYDHRARGGEADVGEAVLPLVGAAKEEADAGGFDPLARADVGRRIEVQSSALDAAEIEAGEVEPDPALGRARGDEAAAGAADAAAGRADAVEREILDRGRARG